MQDSYLQHHGIKGMKWGVRRYQNEDGTLTPEGKKRYEDDGNGGYKKRSRYDRLYDKYKTLGYDDEKAAKAAKGRVAAERSLVVMGGIAVAAVGAYAGYRIYDNSKDRFIAPDKIIQTVHKGDASERIKPGNPFYATYDKKDNTIYSSKVFSHFDSDSKITQLYSKAGIKVASEKTGRQVFEELAKNDPEIAAYAKRFGATGKSKQDYLKFAYSLVLRNDSDTAKQMGVSDLDHDGIHKKFYDALKKKGYGAIIDVNDSKREGFTFNPVVIFDNSVKHVVSSTKATAEHLSPERTRKGLTYSKMRKSLLNPINDPIVRAEGMVFAAALGITVSQNSELNAQVRFVERYREEHPNTELTNAQIAAKYTKYQERWDPR